mgnify:CR=1 FL=1
MTATADDERNRRSWSEAFGAYTSPRVLVMFVLGFSSGLPFLLIFSTLSAWLTEAGVSLQTIGFASYVGLAYTIKFAWAPLVDRLRAIVGPEHVLVSDGDVDLLTGFDGSHQSLEDLLGEPFFHHGLAEDVRAKEVFGGSFNEVHGGRSGLVVRDGGDGGQTGRTGVGTGTSSGVGLKLAVRVGFFTDRSAHSVVNLAQKREKSRCRRPQNVSVQKFSGECVGGLNLQFACHRRKSLFSGKICRIDRLCSGFCRQACQKSMQRGQKSEMAQR